jgi:uncharacterized protein YecE (DUF72 family)
MHRDNLNHRLHIGTSGWSYRHWEGIFYPEGLKPDKYLEYYITHFDCVELNASFYNLPRLTTVSGWLNRTPVSFRFCPKLSRLITHQLQLAGIEEAMQKFFDVFEGMKERMGPVLVQLPPGLSYNKQLITSFFSLIKEKYSYYSFAVEPRNKSWINDDFIDLLQQYGIAFVIADSGKRYPSFEGATAGFVYLRFHGREQLYASDYSEDILREYGEKVRKWLAEGLDVWIFFNNDYHGYAIKNAEKLIEITAGI